MNQRWTLRVENFAKIKYAEVEIAPLMCIVGDNNAGKSYLMSLLWGLLAYGKDYFPTNPPEAKAYKKCEAFLEQNINKEVQLSDDDIQMYIDWFNYILENNKKALLKKIFNFDVKADLLRIVNYNRENSIIIKWDDKAKRFSASKTYVKFPKTNKLTKEIILRINSYIVWQLLMGGVAAPLYTPIVNGRRLGEPIYMPASRTGFMLTYKSLLERSLQASFGSGLEDSNSNLTAPFVDFLQLITKFESNDNKKNNRKFGKLIDFLEFNMTKGNIDTINDFMPTIHYQPKGTTKKLPLYASSSVIAEVSPMLLTLKSNINFGVMIIEEPEAHLHPSLQKEMARFVVKLMKIKPVWITTHSDTILQHINNMIKLENHTDKKALQKQFNYEDDDLLKTSDVKMYQFNAADRNKSSLEPLESTEYGFVVPTFNEALSDLLEEVYAFEGDE